MFSKFRFFQRQVSWLSSQLHAQQTSTRTTEMKTATVDPATNRVAAPSKGIGLVWLALDPVLVPVEPPFSEDEPPLFAPVLDPSLEPVLEPVLYPPLEPVLEPELDPPYEPPLEPAPPPTPPVQEGTLPLTVPVAHAVAPAPVALRLTNTPPPTVAAAVLLPLNFALA